jgi:pimeloyl-ACP methyl ester carboxylesterase
LGCVNAPSHQMKLTSLFFAFFTSFNCWSQAPINKEESIPIGGILQFIQIKGKDDSLPLLLFLHGGPGRSVISYAEKFTSKLQEHFVVVQWDQRQTGKTMELNSSPVPLTLEVFDNDTHELIETLLKRFHRQKLYLVAHSWGTALGFYIAGNYPDLLYAYIPIGSMVNQLESERIVLGMMKDRAVRSSNQYALQELATVRIPFENGEQLYFHRKWLADLNGIHKKISKSEVTDWSSTWLNIFNDASKLDLNKSLPSIECPIYFFAGRKDYQTNSSITEAYYNRLKAPVKKLFWFEKSGHSIPSSAPDLMQDIIINKILPEASINGSKGH